MNRLAALIAIILFAGCTLLALGRPFIPWDSWWYHLPFSARLWNIGGGAESFHLSPLVYGRWLGNPKSWEWIQGLCWTVTGSLYAIIVPQLLLCVAYFAYVSHVHRIPISWVILAFFASPMLFIHYQAVYLDLPAAICVAIGFLMLFDLLEKATTPNRPFPWLRATACIAMLGLAGNIKYQSLMAALAACGIVAVVYLFTGKITVAIRVRLLAVLAVAVLLSFAWAFRNGVVHGNPLYPLSVKANGAQLFDGPEHSEGDASPPTYRLSGSRIISVPQPLNFVLSATELDWTLRGIPAWYSIDSSVGMSLPQRGTAGSRTGGWGGLFFVVNVGLLVVQLLRRRREADRTQRLLAVCTMLLLLANAAFPRSHELRYWLYIPLIMIPVNLRYLSRQCPARMVSGALLALSAYGVIHTLASPNSELFTARAVSVARLRAETPPDVVRALEVSGRYCYPVDVSSLLPTDATGADSPWRHREAIDPDIFRFSRAVTGLPGFVSGVAADCPGQQ
jgi:hypothetical protein